MVGGLLLGVAWSLNWLLPGPRTHVLFFSLWLGYILVVDALLLRRTGSSLLTRSPRDFGMLFVISAPVWWLFEAINWRTGNWEYLGRELFSDLEYFVLASSASRPSCPPSSSRQNSWDPLAGWRASPAGHACRPRLASALGSF